jgi:hypothetical protein
VRGLATGTSHTKRAKPDFVLFLPNVGIVVLEAKNWKSTGGNSDSPRQNPMDQLNKQSEVVYRHLLRRCENLPTLVEVCGDRQDLRLPIRQGIVWVHSENPQWAMEQFNLPSSAIITLEQLKSGDFATLMGRLPLYHGAANPVFDIGALREAASMVKPSNDIDACFAQTVGDLEEEGKSISKRNKFHLRNEFLSHELAGMVLKILAFCCCYGISSGSYPFKN